MSDIEDKSEISMMLNYFINHCESSITEFNKLVLGKQQIDSKSDLKLLKELINLDNISTSNFSRLRSFNDKLNQNGEFKIVNNQERRELQILLIKTSTSLQLITDILGTKDHKIVNIVDKTLNKIDELKLLSAS